MKIFISWSGERSHHVAEALRNWLPHVIQGLQPWLSTNDIDKGVRWAADMASHLEDSRVGIICFEPGQFRSSLDTVRSWCFVEDD